MHAAAEDRVGGGALNGVHLTASYANATAAAIPATVVTNSSPCPTRANAEARGAIQ